MRSFSISTSNFSVLFFILTVLLLLDRCPLDSSSASSAMGIPPRYSLRMYMNQSRDTSKSSPKRFRCRRWSFRSSHLFRRIDSCTPHAIGQAPLFLASVDARCANDLSLPRFSEVKVCCPTFLGLEFVETSSRIGCPTPVMELVSVLSGLGYAPPFIGLSSRRYSPLSRHKSSRPWRGH